MNEDQNTIEQEQERGLTPSHPAVIGGATFLTAGVLDFAAHLGPAGLVAGGIAAIIAARHGDDIYKYARGVISPITSSPLVRKSLEQHGFLSASSQDQIEDEAIESYPESAPRKPEPEDVPTQRMKQPVAALFGNYPEDETLRLGRVLATGERFDPHFNQLLGRGWIAAANQGFGKSVLNSVVIENAGKCGIPVIVLDHKGEYDTMKDLPFMKTLLAAGNTELINGEYRVDYVLTPENVDHFVETVIEGQHQAIINLPSYGFEWIGKATISAAVGQALMRYAEKQRRLRRTLLPCIIIMDEAQLYVPQDPGLLPPEAQQNKEVLANLKNAYFALVSNGRSAGYTLGFSTQSLTYIAKSIIKSSQVRIFGRHAEKNDLDMCADIINPTVATRADIEAFPPGVGVVFGFSEKPVVVQFDRKQSRDRSETPGIERLRQRRNVQQQRPPDSGSLDNLLEANNLSVDDLLKVLLERMPDVDPYDARYSTEPEQPAVREQVAQQYYYQQPAQRMPDIPPAQPAQQSPYSQRMNKYQRPLEVWHSGNQSVRTFAAALDMGESAAYKLLQDMDRLGLIEMKKKR